MALSRKDLAATKGKSYETQIIDQVKEYNRSRNSIFLRKPGILRKALLTILFAIVFWSSTIPPNSNPAPTKGFQDCLNRVCGGKRQCVRYSSIGKDREFFEWVTLFNRARPVVPTAVVRPQNTEDVSGFVKCAANHDIKVQARSGGHSYANYGLGGQDGSLSIDLQNLKYVTVNESSWDATIGAGSLLGEIDEILEKKGNRVFPHGVCPGIGIGGHATVGGLGPSSRMWGATVDHVLEVKVVIANGTIVTANKTSNEDLFFAIRGAGAGFGVVTEFKIRTHKKPPTTMHLINRTPYTQLDQMVEQFLIWQNLTGDPDLDPRFGTEFVLEPQGSKITGTWYGTNEDFKKSGISEKLPGGLTIVESSWVETARWLYDQAQLYLADIPTEFLSRSLGLREQDQLSRAATERLFRMVKENAEKIDAKWFIIFDATGGEVSRPTMNSTAFAHRDKVRFYQSYGYSLRGPLSGPKEELLMGIHQFIIENISGGEHTTYPGYVDPYLEKPQEVYWGSNLPRLQTVKTVWDPSDVFHNPQSVQPL
ncbi:FAD binding domain-containing protein [Colletotrichum sublineola]|nr:FAD binding domain-containing protein [Colletotrichum sublineola]